MRRFVPISVVLFGVAACGGADSTAPGVPRHPTANSAIALGAQFSCALTADGKAYCWGDGLAGELGDSAYLPKLVPTATTGGRSYVAIAAGVQSVCALDERGTPWCWGDDPAQPGVRASYAYAPTAIPVQRALTSITVGRKFACGLDSDGAAYCWGENGHGQIGVADTLPHATPTRVSGSVRFTSISAGFWHVCALASSGAAYCWGDNQYGELASGDTLPVVGPHLVAKQTFRSITSGSIHSCGILVSGAAMCWGANFAGQLGDGTSDRRVTPTPVAGGLSFTSIKGGRANSIFVATCGLTAGGEIYCWGWNSKGQLGAANTTDACVPFQPPGTTNSTTVTNVCSYRPVKAAGASGIASFDVGLEHVCALTSSQRVLCWGEGAHGELGDGTGLAHGTPGSITGDLKFP